MPETPKHDFVCGLGFLTTWLLIHTRRVPRGAVWRGRVSRVSKSRASFSSLFCQLRVSHKASPGSRAGELDLPSPWVSAQAKRVLKQRGDHIGVQERTCLSPFPVKRTMTGQGGRTVSWLRMSRSDLRAHAQVCISFLSLITEHGNLCPQVHQALTTYGY